MLVSPLACSRLLPCFSIPGSVIDCRVATSLHPIRYACGMCAQKTHVLVFGLGYVGGRLVRELQRHDNVSVSAVTRRTPHQTICPTLALADVCSADVAKFIATACETATVIVSTVPPGPSGDQVLPILLPHVNRASCLSRMVYISSTSVYGDHHGRQVTEEIVPVPTSAKARARLKAELEWCAIGTRHSVHNIVIMRLAAIYGVGRSALHAVLRGKRDSSDHMTVSRIHVDDAVAALSAAILLPNNAFLFHAVRPLVINVGDDEPAPRDNVLAFAAALLSRCTDPQVVDNQSDHETLIARSKSTRAADRTSKRISNTLMKRLLSVHLQYPTFREGLTAIACEEFELQ